LLKVCQQQLSNKIAFIPNMVINHCNKINIKVKEDSSNKSSETRDDDKAWHPSDVGKFFYHIGVFLIIYIVLLQFDYKSDYQ